MDPYPPLMLFPSRVLVYVWRFSHVNLSTRMLMHVTFCIFPIYWVPYIMLAPDFVVLSLSLELSVMLSRVCKLLVFQTVLVSK